MPSSSNVYASGMGGSGTPPRARSPSGHAGRAAPAAFSHGQDPQTPFRMPAYRPLLPEQPPPRSTGFISPQFLDLHWRVSNLATVPHEYVRGLIDPLNPPRGRQLRSCGRPQPTPSSASRLRLGPEAAS